MDIYEQLRQQKRNIEDAYMGGGGLGPGMFGDPRVHLQMQQQAQNAYVGLSGLGMQGAFTSTYKPKKKTQAMKRYEKLIKKRDRIRLCVSMSVSVFLVLMSVAWFFGFNGLLLSGSALGVITAITTLVWWMDR
jgi:hypothetical protein